MLHKKGRIKFAKREVSVITCSVYLYTTFPSPSPPHSPFPSPYSLPFPLSLPLSLPLLPLPLSLLSLSPPSPPPAVPPASPLPVVIYDCADVAKNGHPPEAAAAGWGHMSGTGCCEKGKGRALILCMLTSCSQRTGGRLQGAWPVGGEGKDGQHASQSRCS